MSLPITISAASAVAGAATDLISSVQQSVGTAAGSFAEVLGATSSPKDDSQALTAVTDTDTSAASSWQLASERIIEILATAGIDVNESLEFRVQSDGSLQVANAHPRAAEIERRLTEDSQLQDLAVKFRRTGGDEFVTLDFAGSGGLTNNDSEANMSLPSSYFGGPGG